MTIDQLVQMAERIHDAEGYHLGSSSSREYRNAFWARVIGCAYHGHPTYNAVPDRQWHLKKADPSRPQTDDVATSMPSRSYWDCINGVGKDGYSFAVNPHGEPLSPEQIVYAPPVPAGSAPPPQPQPPMPTQPPGREEALDEMKWLDAYYAAPEGLQRPNGLSLNGKPDFEGIAAWYLDVYQRERMAMKSRADARAAYVSDIRHSDEWKAKHPGETP